METAQFTFKEDFGTVFKKTFPDKKHSRERELIIFAADLAAKGMINMQKFSKEFVEAGIRVNENENEP